VRFLSGGSDYHADHKKGAKVVRRMGERGLTVEEFEEDFLPAARSITGRSEP
jgi:hypothetical protein